MQDKSVPSCQLEHRDLQDSEQTWILGKLGPNDDLPPVDSVCFLLSGIGEQAHLVIGDTAVHEEKSCENAAVGCHGNVDGSSNFVRRQESVRNVFVSRKCGDVVALERYEHRDD